MSYICVYLHVVDDHDIQNDKKNEKEKEKKPLNNNDYDVDIRRGLRRCFKYTQSRLKLIYKAFLEYNRRDETKEERKIRKLGQREVMYDQLNMEHPQSNNIRRHLSEKANGEGAMSPGTENEGEGAQELGG